MASLRDLNRQKNSVQNIAKVTDALQAVSAVKFRKAEARVTKARPYAENMQEMMQSVASSATGQVPMLAGRGQARTIAVATITSDRGLCGGFNAQVLRRTTRFRQEQNADLKQVVVGRKGLSFFRFRRIGTEAEYSGFTDTPTYEKAQEIGHELTSIFEEARADEVYLIYNRFQNAAVQTPVLTRLLPVAPENDEEEGEQEGSDLPFEFIPDPETILNTLIPRYVETLVWQALLESAAGEHGARMTAMKNATDNANELVDTLTLQINKARQAQITQEILEIVSGAEALTAG